VAVDEPVACLKLLTLSFYQFNREYEVLGVAVDRQWRFQKSATDK